MKYVIIPIFIIGWFLIMGFLWSLWYSSFFLWSMKPPNTSCTFLTVEDYILVDTPWEYLTHYNTWSRYNW